MNWLSNFARPGLKKQGTEEKRETPDNLWIKDPLSGELIYRSELEAADWVTPSGFHMRIGPEPRFKQLFDDHAWQKVSMPKVATDPLKFKDDKKYVDRLKAARSKVGRDDCMAAGYGRIGGARMQEGILSLMQMPRTTIAVQMLREAGLPYIVILADPTTGGVTASYAMLGDIHIAEPGALIGFAGPRVIEQTIRQKLPEGFQRSEYLLDKGMVDMVVDRRKLKDTIATMLSLLMAKGDAANDAASADVLELEDVIPAAAPKRKPASIKPPRAKAAE